MDQPGWPFLFTDRPEKHKLGRGRWDFASLQLWLNSVKPFQRKSWKCPSQWETGWWSCFSNRPEKLSFGWGRWDLASCQVSLNSIWRFQRRSPKMSKPIRGQGSHLDFPISPKNTNLVEYVEILLPVKFLWIPFSSFRGEVEKCEKLTTDGRRTTHYHNSALQLSALVHLKWQAVLYSL